MFEFEIDCLLKNAIKNTVPPKTGSIFDKHNILDNIIEPDRILGLIRSEGADFRIQNETNKDIHLVIDYNCMGTYIVKIKEGE